MTPSERLNRLNDALVCLGDLHAAVKLQAQDLDVDQSALLHGLLTDLANNLGCTTKIVTIRPGPVEVQRTERMMLQALERHGQHVHADAANAQHLRRENEHLRARIAQLESWNEALDRSEQIQAEDAAVTRAALAETTAAAIGRAAA